MGFGCGRDVVVIARIRLGHCGHSSGLPLTVNPPDAQGECSEPETEPRYFKMQDTKPKGGNLFRDLGATGETVYNFCSLVNSEDWAHMKKLRQYPYNTAEFD